MGEAGRLEGATGLVTQIISVHRETEAELVKLRRQYAG
jgi:hypothetical protein